MRVNEFQTTNQIIYLEPSSTKIEVKSPVLQVPQFLQNRFTKQRYVRIFE